MYVLRKKLCLSRDPAENVLGQIKANSKLLKMAVTYGPLVVNNHARLGYLAIPIVFGDFPAVVGSPYSLGVVPARQEECAAQKSPSNKSTKKTGRTCANIRACPAAINKGTQMPSKDNAVKGGKPHPTQVRTFSVHVISSKIIAPASSQRGQNKNHKSKRPSAATSRSDKSVMIGSLRVRLDGSQPITLRDRLGAIPNASTYLSKRRRVTWVAEEKPKLIIFSYYASGKDSGEPVEQIAEATPNIPTEAIHLGTRQFARRNRQPSGQAGTSGQALSHVDSQHEGTQIPFSEETNVQIEEGGLPTSNINPVIDLPTRENFQAMSDDDKYQAMQQCQSQMAALLNEMRQLVTTSLRHSMEPVSTQNQQHPDGSAPANHPAASTTGLLPQATGQDIIDSSNIMLPQTETIQGVAVQRHEIQKIIQDMFAQQSEGIQVADLYSVPYLVHHQFKKLPEICPKVPKTTKV
ncbi:hypothetical protein Taro_008342 [Colocasia esculenta]|uniref:Uncharacterized protein n=1 Tax=Colocasia esculenta TaxID=4460 RepID=A0A843U337_COLES|nr:hypothetical protein [Colocasia esculenta]